MTIRVKIGSIEKDFADVDASWINEQINRTRDDGVVVCVQVTIEKDSVDLLLITSDCPHFRGSTGLLSTQENEIVSLWNKHHLNEKTFSPGNLIAFLKQIS